MSLQRKVIIVSGKTGTGKSSKLAEVIGRSEWPRVVIRDPGFGEFRARYFDELDHAVDVLEAERAFSVYVRGKRPAFSSSPFRFAYVPRSSEDGTLLDLSRSLGNNLTVLDECDTLDDPKYFPEYDELISRGRHYGVSLCLATVEPMSIPKAARRQATEIIAFAQDEPSDLKYLAEKVRSDEIYRVAELPNFHFFHWKRGGFAYYGPDGSKITPEDHPRDDEGFCTKCPRERKHLTSA